MRYVAGTNIPGYMPDSEPAEFETFEEARSYIIDMILMDSECAETDEQAEELEAFAKEVEERTSEFAGICLDRVYWVHREEVFQKMRFA